MRLKLILIAISITAVIAIYLQLVEHLYFGLFKALTTILIIQIPLSCSKNIDEHFKIVLIIGLICCLLGDIILLDEAKFIAGLIAFLIAHLMFCYGFHYQNKKPLKLFTLLPFAFIGLVYFQYLHSHLGDITVPVAVYIGVIVCMSWLATELYLSNKNNCHLAIAAGSMLFLISDATLAFNKFIGEFYYSSLLILGTYWLAITLFACSTFLVKRDELKVIN